jgi:hypothetical protein
MDAIPRAVEVCVCARANGVSSGASRCASDENGRYYIAVEPRRAAMALLLVTGGLVGGHDCGLGRVQAGRQADGQRQAGSARRAQQMQHAVVTWSGPCRRLRLYSKKLAT